MYSIGEMADKMGVNASTLRFYDRNGLLPFVERDAAGRRKFSENDMGLIEVITRLKQVDIPVKDIARFVNWCMQGDQTMQDRYDYLDDAEQSVEAKITQLEDNLAFLRFKKWYYKTAIEAGTEAIHYELGTTDVDSAKQMAIFKKLAMTSSDIHELVNLPKS